MYGIGIAYFVTSATSMRYCSSHAVFISLCIENLSPIFFFFLTLSFFMFTIVA